MRSALLLLFLWGPALVAQTDKPAPDSNQPDAASPENRFQQLTKDYNKVYRDWLKKIQTTKDLQEHAKLIQENPQKGFVDKFLALAEDHPKTPGGLNATVWVMRNSYSAPQAAKKAVGLLEKYHLKSKEIEQAVYMLRYTRGVDTASLLRKIIAENPHRIVKGKATFTLGQMLLQARRGGKPNPEAVKLLEAVEKEYATIPYYGSKTLGEASTSALFEIRHLSIGRVAPDIEGEDIDGVKFKLSDYRGKVVVIDFWGDW